jgi:hypothetical protein
MDMILLAYPQRIAVKDKKGRVPSAFLKSNYFKGLIREQMYLLHTAISDGLSTFVPTLGEVQDGNGMTPLHHACARHIADAVEITQLLLHEFPQSTTFLDNHGNPPLPSVYFTQYASRKDHHGMLPLHRLVACPNNIHVHHLQVYIEAYPAGVSTPDNYDMLPFHHACFNKTSSIEKLL